MAIAIQNHLFCHMPKTGGDFITSYLRKEHEGIDPPALHGHVGFADIPSKWLEGKTLFGSIRDPWSWYTSWWMHAKSVNLEKGGLERYGAGSNGFRAVLAGALSCTERTTPNNAGLIWSHDLVAGRAKYLEMGAGLYSWVFHHVFGDAVKLLIDIPQVYQGIEELLNTPVDPEEWKPRNTRHQRADTAVDNPSILYDKKMIKAVREADGDLINRLGYTEPFSMNSKAVIRL